MAPWALAQGSFGPGAGRGGQGSGVFWVQGLVQGIPIVPGCLEKRNQPLASCPLWNNWATWVDSAHPPTYLDAHQPHRAWPQPMSLPGPGPVQPASLFLLLPHSLGTGLWREELVSEGIRHTPAQDGAHALLGPWALPLIEGTHRHTGIVHALSRPGASPCSILHI